MFLWETNRVILWKHLVWCLRHIKLTLYDVIAIIFSSWRTEINIAKKPQESKERNNIAHDRGVGREQFFCRIKRVTWNMVDESDVEPKSCLSTLKKDSFLMGYDSEGRTFE